MSIRGRVKDVWRTEVPNSGQPALGVMVDVPDKENCFYIEMPPDGRPYPVKIGDEVFAGPHHWSVNGGPQQPKLGWLFDRNTPLH